MRARYNNKLGLLPMSRMKIDRGQNLKGAFGYTNSDSFPGEPHAGRGNIAAARAVEASDVVERSEERPNID